jgi:hypothetical protein
MLVNIKERKNVLKNVINILGENNMATMYSKVARLKSFLKWCFEKYQPKCYFCHEPLDFNEFYRNIKGGHDKLTEHHIDHNHWNDKIKNRELCHKKCHDVYHKNTYINPKDRIVYKA